VAAVVTGGAYALWRATGRRTLLPGPLQLGMPPAAYRDLTAWTPIGVGIHTAILLIVSGISRQLFVPNLPLPQNFFGALFGLIQIAIALSFFYGALTRFGAALLALTWFAGLLLFGPVLLLEHVFLVGAAAFLFAAGRGPLSVDAVVRGTEPLRPPPTSAVTTLRVLTGASLAVLAFTEKLWNVPLAQAFLANYDLNFLPGLGFDVSERTFILIAGTVELTLGALLMSGAFMRVVIVIMWLPFNLTLPLLGWRELVGHLPIYGIMAVLLICGDERELEHTKTSNELQA
ncbi:MAG: DoxX protein, partial [Gemmatimonadota bacterium]